MKVCFLFNMILHMYLISPIRITSNYIEGDLRNWLEKFAKCEILFSLCVINAIRFKKAEVSLILIQKGLSKAANLEMLCHMPYKSIGLTGCLPKERTLYF